MPNLRKEQLPLVKDIFRTEEEILQRSFKVSTRILAQAGPDSGITSNCKQVTAMRQAIRTPTSMTSKTSM